MTLEIDEEFKNLIPPLTDEEFKQLEENILKEGCRDPIVVWNGIIIDGHNRYKICTENSYFFETIDINENCDSNISTREEVIEWIIRNQFGRRNLNSYDRGILALRLKPIFKEKAKEKQLSTLKQNAVNLKSDERSEINTDKELAKIAGLGHDTIHKVEVIENKAPNNIKEQVKSGELSINQAYILTKSAEETKIKNEENLRKYNEQLESEKIRFEEKKKIEELETSLPENTVVLDKFRKPEEKHIFGITDFNYLTTEQLNDCIKHSKKYQDAIYKINQLYVDNDCLRAWNCIADSTEMIEIELSGINSAIQKLVAMQNYFKGVKYSE